MNKMSSENKLKSGVPGAANYEEFNAYDSVLTAASVRGDAGGGPSKHYLTHN